MNYVRRLSRSGEPSAMQTHDNRRRHGLKRTERGVSRTNPAVQSADVLIGTVILALTWIIDVWTS